MSHCLRRAAVLLAFGVAFVPSLATALDVGGSIASDSRWTLADSPINVNAPVTIDAGAVLTVEPGVQVRFAAGASFDVVQGALSAQGTSGAPIIFTSHRDIPSPPQTPAAGDWGALRFLPGTQDAGSVLSHVQVRYGTGVVAHGASPTFNNVRIEHSAGPAIALDLQASPVGRGLVAEHNQLNGILVPAGEISGDVVWALVGIPYVLEQGILHIGAPEFGLAPGVLQLAEGVIGALELTLPAPAPGGGMPVTIVSSIPSVAGVPTQVIVPAGDNSVQIPVEATNVGSSTISVSAVGYGTAYASVQVVAAPTLGFEPGEVVVSVGGEGALTVSISDLAPAEGREVELATTPEGRVNVPANVVIAPGATTAQVPVTGLALGTVTLQASAPGYVGALATIQVKPVSLNPPASLLVAPSLTRNLPILLSDPAPAGGLTITLDNPAPAVFGVPGSVQVAEGESSVDVPVEGLTLGSAQLIASAPGYDSGFTQVTVESIAISLQPAGVISIPKGLFASYGVRLSKAAPAGGIDVSLATSDPAIATVSPAIVHVPQGQTVALLPISVGGENQGNTALDLDSPGLVGVSVDVTVTEAAHLEFSRTAVAVGKGLRNYEAEVYVRRRSGAANYAPQTLLQVEMSSGVPGKVGVPASVTIPAGQYQVAFRVSGMDVTETPVNVTAFAGGYAVPADPLAVTVVTPELRFESLDGSRTTASVRDNFYVNWHVPGAVHPTLQTAIAEQTIALSIDEADPAGIVPGFHDRFDNPITQIVIAAGRNDSYGSASQQYTYVDTPVATGSYRVGASVAGIGAWASAPQTVAAAELRFSRVAATVGQGLHNYVAETYVQRIVNGQSAAVVEPLDITLVSADPDKVGVPLTVTIPAGQYQAAFRIAGVDLTDQPVALSASADGHTSPATPLAVTVVTPELRFESLDGSRTTASVRDNFYVNWYVPGAVHPTLQTAIAEQTIALSIDEADPAGIVPGFHDRFDNPITQIVIAAGRNDSHGSASQQYTYVDTPVATGSYRVGASVAGIGAWASAPQTVAAAELRFSRVAATVGQGLHNYVAETYVQRIVNGQSAAVVEPLDITLVSADPDKVGVPLTVTIPAGQYQAAFRIAGVDLTDQPIALSASADGHTSPATPLAVTVVTPELRFESLDGSRTTASVRDNFYVNWYVPGAVHPTLQTAIAEQTIALSIDEADPAGIVPGFHDRFDNPITQIVIAAGRNDSHGSASQQYSYVDTPVATGSYRVGASVAGIGAWASAPQTVAAAELRFSVATTIVGKGLTNYAYELTVRRTVGGQLFNGIDPVDVAVACVSPAVCSTPTILTIPANQSQAYLRVTGTGLGATRILLSAPGYTSAQELDVTTVLPVLVFNNLPTQLAAGAGANFTVSVQTPGAIYATLQSAALPISVDLTSAQPSVATVPSTIVIAAGDTTSPNAALQALAPGSTTVTASGVDLTPAVSPTITVIDP